jgi:putative DNA primase/helicase
MNRPHPSNFDSWPQNEQDDYLAQVYDLDAERDRLAATVEALLSGNEPRPKPPRKKGEAPDFSEEAFALLFAERHAAELRYVAKWGNWLSWDGSHWRFDSTLHAFDLARKIAREAAHRCDSDRMAAQIASAKTVAAIEKLSKADRRIAATEDQWDCATDVFNASLAIIDLKTGTSHPPNPLGYHTKIAAASQAHEGTACPIWLKFLNTVTNNDADLIGFLQRFLGYCMTGHVTEHSLVFLFGTGANGKGVFTATVAGIFGDYAIGAPMEMFLISHGERHPTEIAKLRGARLVIAQETQKGRRWDESKLKTLTGGDTLTARFMRGDFFDFKPTHKFLIAGNHKPSFRTVDEAIRRRFLLVPFLVCIPEKDRDPYLAEKLKAEWPAILRWMVDGCLEWRRGGLNPPKAVREATADYLADQDTVGQWIDESTEAAVNAFEKTRDLFLSWKNWCEPKNIFVGIETSFTDTLKDRGYKKGRVGNDRGFHGLRLTENKPAAENGEPWEERF